MTYNNMANFVRESNRIEGILREPTEEEVHAHYVFCENHTPTVEDVVRLVKVVQPNAVLRDSTNIPGVRVGNHIAPPSSPDIRRHLEEILHSARINWDAKMCGHTTVDTNWIWRLHCDYETLHPFTDGNGRSGRALWLWCMGGRAPLGFLHQFYYQTLSAYL